MASGYPPYQQQQGLPPQQQQQQQQQQHGQVAPHQMHQQQPPQQQQQRAIPLYDMFLDLPHPLASTACPPPVVISAPTANPEMEQEISSNLSRIARFAFPEFDDAVSQNVPRNQPINRFSLYAMQSKSFQQYAFSMQLRSGVRLHGHVRRYLPNHPIVKTRYDVGRRGERALVIMTRANGGDLVYSAILKTLDAVSSQQAAVGRENIPHADNPQKWFLHALYHQHQALCIQFQSIPPQERKPMTLTVENLEAGDINVNLMNLVDTSRYLIPTTLLSATPDSMESITQASILPILRVLGIANALRLLSALLSERRILLMSASPTRLAQCARSALSIMAQGLLNWQHLYIPVLPPHLFQYLAAPVPYLIGMLKDLKPRLDSTKENDLGEVIIIDLDLNAMETRGIAPHEVAKKIPDLFRPGMGEGSSSSSTNMSGTELLAQDLVDLVKVDKRALYGESTLTNVSETAAKATKAVKTGLLKLRNKGKQFLQNRSGSMGSDTKPTDRTENTSSSTQSGPPTAGSLIPDFIYSQGSQNETAEEEARIAFTSFFLSMFGNMRWYLSANPGKLPELDRQRFLQQKRAMNEEYMPIWPLLENFCQTQMLEQFAKARVEEVRTRLPVTSDSPLFSQCSNYHRLHNIDFHPLNVRRVARQVAHNSPSRRILQTTARRMTMLLTSNRTFEGDYNKAVAQLVEQCRECSSVLFDVMSVVWVRMRDSKGLHWKHGYQSLQILRNLLYHGPMAAIAEATDGLDKIRLMQFYNDNMRSQICTQIRQAATQVYNLLVDRAKLFAIRRLCLNKRRLLRKSDQGGFVKDNRIRPTYSFKAIHAAFHPSAKGQVAPVTSGRQSFLAPSGLFAPAMQAAQQASATQDMLGLFDDMSLANNPAAPANNDVFSQPSAQPPQAHAGMPAAGAMVSTQQPQAHSNQAHPYQAQSAQYQNQAAAGQQSNNANTQNPFDPFS